MQLIKIYSIAAYLIFVCNFANAQPITQIVRGVILDKESQAPLIGATIVINNSNPLIGSTTDTEGNYKLTGVPIGRYDFKVSYIGYKEIIIPEVLVSSGKELVLNVELMEDFKSLNEVVVKASSTKGEAMNSMSLISGRSVNVEMTKRYAGGLDDPSRLASSFAGVSTDGGIESNAIMVRGNSPTGILWQIEGVEVPTPSHFSNSEVLGGGAITMFSNNMLSTSDFFTGAFPAEYGNALSGVFDMKLTTGNSEKYEHSAQVGVLGIDVASEGPFKKGAKASYLFNYRYSTMGLVSSFLPDGGLPVYQDLCFNLNFPTKKAGTFSLWAIGGISNFSQVPEKDSVAWESEEDKLNVNADFISGTASLKHKIIVGNKSFIHTSLTASNNYQHTTEDILNSDYNYDPRVDFNFLENRYSAKSFINHKFSNRHTNRTGVSYTLVDYDYEMANISSGAFSSVSNSTGNTSYLQAFTQSKFQLTERVTATIGLNALYLALNKKYSIDPRAGLKWNQSSKHSFSLAYGVHSQTQFFNIYFIEKEENGQLSYPNKDLDLSKAHHFVMAYDLSVSEKTKFKVEPYYQILSNIPVVENTSTAIINIPHYHTFNEELISTGKGRNYGVDVTLERNLSEGFYYLFTASLFQSKYTGDDGVERNTAYNNNYVANLLAGKEWKLRNNSNNIIGISGRLYLKGGNRISPVDEVASSERQEVVTDETRAFEESWPSYYRADASFYFRKNKPKYSSIWSVQINNCLFSPTSFSREYNYKKDAVVEVTDGSPFPSISYKIEF
ncbi:MAG: TonB-dependent receptor [Bacteroidota bacterium]|nr:MAG: TonB-dependent receptor [Bacteroidota bacterium]